MHMAILSLAIDILVFPITYEFKTQELFTKLGQQDWVQDIEIFAVDYLIQQFEQFDACLSTLPDLRTTLFAKVEQEYHYACKASQVLRQSYDLYGLNNRTTSDRIKASESFP